MYRQLQHLAVALEVNKRAYMYTHITHMNVHGYVCMYVCVSICLLQ